MHLDVRFPHRWHGVADPNHAGPDQEKLRRRVEALWTWLEPARVPVFTVMVQAHVEQILSELPALDFSFVAVFDTRWTGLGPVPGVPGHREAPTRHRSPVPLLGEADVARRGGGGARAPDSLFWAGGCHARVRCDLHLLGGRVRRCDDALPEAAFDAELASAAWALAPRGTTHASTMLARAVLADAFI